MLAASAVTLVASMALSGCGPDNPAPKPFNPPKAPSAASSSSSVDAVPQMPDEAKQNNAAGAKAFVRYYFEVVSYAASTGEVATLRDLSSSSCGSCASVASRIEERYANGGHLEGKGAQARELSVANSEADQVMVRGIVTLFAQVDYASPSATPKREGREDHDSELTIDRSSGTWKMQNWVFLS